MTFKSKLYDLYISRFYDQQLEQITAQARQLCIARLGLSEGATVVDLGCGSGLNQPYLAAAVGERGRVIGLDASNAMLAQALQRAQTEGYASRLQLIEADLRQLQTLRQQHAQLDGVDAVVATLIFSVVPDWQAVFAEAFDLLRSGGRFAIMDTYWAHPTLRQRLINLTYAADARRKSFALLEQAAQGFELSFFPPDGSGLFIASGSRP